MKRPRPHIPLSVRVAVAERMAVMKAIGASNWTYTDLYFSRVILTTPDNKWPLKDRLESLLYHLFKDEKAHLDHDPALVLRPFDEVTGKYTPDANDVNHLVYLTVAEHLQKTVGRTVGASKTVTTKGSDVGLKAKFARLERPTKFKKKIPSRPFPKKQRSFRSVKG
jgi:hypothetical protein